MTAVAATLRLPEDEATFRATAQRLFGHITQRFLDHRGPACRLTTTPLGRCQFTEIKARAHGVLGERVVRRSFDVDSIKAVMQVNGQTRFKQNGACATIETGTWMLYDPTHPYALVNATAVHQVILQVPREMFAIDGLSRLRQPQVFHQGIEGLPSVVGTMLTATAREIDALAPPARARLGETLSRLIGALLSFDDRPPGDVQRTSLDVLRRRVVEFIDNNLDDPSLSVDLITASLRCSKRYVHRAFEGYTMTPERYLWEARLERSRERLLSPERRHLSICQIAFSCGFNSSAHFSRTFKTRYGMTPREFRLLYARGERVTNLAAE